MQALQSFQPLLVSWRVRRGELVTLTHFEPTSAVPRLDDRTTLCGFYFNELLLQAIVRNDPHPQLYREYSRALIDLAGDGVDSESVLRRFEYRLLEATGYGLNLRYDSNQRLVDPAAIYRVQPEIGATIAAGSGDNAKGLMVSGSTLLQLADGVLADARARGEAKRMLRALLVEHIGDKPLFSRSWFEEY